MLHIQLVVQLRIPNLYSCHQVVGEVGKQVLMRALRTQQGDHKSVESSCSSLVYSSPRLITNSLPCTLRTVLGWTINHMVNLQTVNYDNLYTITISFILTEFGQLKNGGFHSAYFVHISQVSSYQILIRNINNICTNWRKPHPKVISNE